MEEEVDLPGLDPTPLEPSPEMNPSPGSTQVEDELDSEQVPAWDDGAHIIVAEALTEPAPSPQAAGSVKAIVEAAIYITDEPLTPDQIAAALELPVPKVKEILGQLVEEYASPDHGLSIREIAGGYKMSTKPEHHEAIRGFVKNLQPPLKLSLAALETLAVISYKQPITGPEIMEIRGVQGAGVLKTLLDRKLIATAGRKNVLGKPMMYKTTREFLVQFGLSSLAELPTLKEFEELGKLALTEGEQSADAMEHESLPVAPLVLEHADLVEHAADTSLAQSGNLEDQIEEQINENGVLDDKAPQEPVPEKQVMDA